MRWTIKQKLSNWERLTNLWNKNVCNTTDSNFRQNYKPRLRFHITFYAAKSPCACEAGFRADFSMESPLEFDTITRCCRTRSDRKGSSSSDHDSTPCLHGDLQQAQCRVASTHRRYHWNLIDNCIITQPECRRLSNILPKCFWRLFEPFWGCKNLLGSSIDRTSTATQDLADLMVSQSAQMSLQWVSLWIVRKDLSALAAKFTLLWQNLSIKYETKRYSTWS